MSPCTACHAGCCRSLAVPLTGVDVLRIERERSLPFDQFARRLADPDGTIARGIAPHLYFDDGRPVDGEHRADEPATPFVLCLKHEASDLHPGTTKCRFLTESPPTRDRPLGEGRCDIYADRPAACRVFPTRFHSNGDLVVLHDPPDRHRDADEPVYSLCPRPWEPADIDPLTAPQDLAVARYENDFFNSVARLWNQSPQAYRLFPAFLRHVYANRVVGETTANPPRRNLRRAA